MLNAASEFRENMRSAAALVAVYDYLTQTLSAPLNFDDLLRARIVYAVSAFDKLIHDLVRIGMVQAYVGRRVETPKYKAEAISLVVVRQLATATIPPPEVIFEGALREKFAYMAFQDPDKITEALSFIWPEQHKWNRIAAGLSEDEKFVRTKLRLIVGRRNAIVHEADVDPITTQKRAISRAECEDAGSFLLQLGCQIARLVA